MTIKQAINYGQNHIQASSPATARFDAELILGFVIGKTREYLFTYPEKDISIWQNLKYKFLIRRRSACEPVAYLLGKKDFFGLNFYVNKNVLVPRPETELMVEEIIKLSTDNNKAKIIDIGTGSGCIIISLAKNIDKDFEFFAIDISKKALRVAKKNSEMNKLENKINFFTGNLLTPVLEKINMNDKIFIAANLPYLSPEQIKNSPSIKKEPYLALEAGKDGLRYYEELFSQIKELKQQKNISGYCLCEIDPSQKEVISNLIREKLNYDFIIKKDLAGLDRLVVVEI